MLTIKFKKLHPDAKAPTKAHDLDAGWDLYANVGVPAFGVGTFTILTGIAVEIPPGYYGQIFGRSGLASKGVFPTGGVIDCTYRGEIGVILNCRYAKLINRGDKIAQLVILPVPQVEFVEVEELAPSERGENGFGSSGR
jgi:dUTP pyrophosphatase